MTISLDLLRLYKAARRASCGKEARAFAALAKARHESALGRRAFSDRWPWHAAANGETFKYCGETVRWLENAESCGLRLVGYSDELLPRRINHRGYYTDSDGSNGVVLRGAVWRLPAAKGRRNRFVYGYPDTHCEGAVLIALDVQTSRERNVDWHYDATGDDDARDCAIWADHFAERAAESEREWNAAWRAGAMWQDSRSELRETKSELRDLLRERREAKREAQQSKPALCRAIETHAKAALRSLTKLRREMAELSEGAGIGREMCGAFNARDARLRAAFNEGAGEAVLS